MEMRTRTDVTVSDEDVTKGVAPVTEVRVHLPAHGGFVMVESLQALWDEEEPYGEEGDLRTQANLSPERARRLADALYAAAAEVQD